MAFRKKVLLALGSAVIWTAMAIPVQAENTESFQQLLTEKYWEDITAASWEGVYYHDDGYLGEYFFIQGVNGTSFVGAVIGDAAADETYFYSGMNWTLDSADSTRASGLWQSDRYTHYQLTESGIHVDESEYRMENNQLDYIYLCSIEDAAQYVTHPNLNDALSLLNILSGETANSSGESAVSASTDPFYGIWCTASHDKVDCDRTVTDLNSKGLPAKVYETTDWNNLNPVHWYVVSAGEYRSEAEAGSKLAAVQAAGYGDAYVKYTGDFQK